MMKYDEPLQNFGPVPQERAPVGLSLLHHRVYYCPVGSSVTAADCNQEECAAARYVLGGSTRELDTKDE